ncbi:MAG TPA: hypothetical protein VF008_30845 [Niastella sp.]
MTTDKLNSTQVKYYDNKEEQRVITGTETKAARRLYQPVRTNHSGIPVSTEGPTSQTKVGYPASIARQFEIMQIIQEETKGKKKG